MFLNNIAPSWSEYCLFFLFSVHCIAPQVAQLFKECWEEFVSFLSRILQIQFDVFLVWQYFLFWNQISYFEGHVYSSLIIEMKSERCQFWKIFWKSSFFDQKSNTRHSNTQSFNCLVFWKQKLTRCKIKMVFSWFLVSILNSDFGYIFWWSVMR